MAITTIKATIQMRRGNEADFDPDQMTAGEWAVSTDMKYVRMCFAPGLCLRMATYESFEEDMLEIQTILATCQDIQAAVEKFEQLAEQHKDDAAGSAALSKSWAVGGTGTRTGEDSDNSKYYAEQAEISYKNASAVANVGVATNTQAGVVKPDGDTITIDQDGTLRCNRIKELEEQMSLVIEALGNTLATG